MNVALLILLTYSVLKKRDFNHQKARKNFRAPGENGTHDPLSFSSDALPLSYWNSNGEQVLPAWDGESLTSIGFIHGFCSYFYPA